MDQAFGMSSRGDPLPGRFPTQQSVATARGRIQMRKGCGRSGICEVVCWHIHSLHGSNGALLCGCDPLLQGRHLGSSLSESEDVVYEKQHILTFLVPEVLCN